MTIHRNMTSVGWTDGFSHWSVMDTCGGFFSVDHTAHKLDGFMVGARSSSVEEMPFGSQTGGHPFPRRQRLLDTLPDNICTLMTLKSSFVIC